MAHPSADRDRDGRLVVLGGGAGEGLRAKPPGRVLLVGAGPGDPELLTIKALKALERADVVVHDRLTPAPILALARRGARMIHVGKRKSRHSVPQEGINALLIALAREGLEVVRLKGGDPSVFGRVGEEVLACREAGVAVEIIPGISAGLAAAATLGAPLTHRGLAQAVTFVTGHAAPKVEGEGYADPDLDWAALARGNQTVVVYMGLSTAPGLAARLIEAGRQGSTPVAIVENASLPNERRLTATLATLAETVAGLEGPAILIIGETAALAVTESAPQAALEQSASEKRA